MRQAKNTRFRMVCLVWMAALLPFAALAGDSADAPRKEASLLLTGSITVAPDGSVSKYSIDHADKVPEGAMGMIRNLVPAWRFVPTRRDGKAVSVRADMSIRLLARKMDGDKYGIGIADANFTDPNAVLPELTSSAAAIKYPPAAIRQRLEATAYVLMQIDAKGKVVQSAIEQINLRADGSKGQMRRWRELFARSVESYMERIQFRVPSEALNKEGFVVARWPVTFVLGRSSEKVYGKWTSYMPGPRKSVPWAGEDQAADRADMVPPGSMQMLAGEPFLKRIQATN